MALELNGTTGVSLVQDGVIQTADIDDGAVTAAKIGSLPAGSVLQVVSGTYDSTLSTNSTSFTDLISLNITPVSTSSKMLISVSIYFSGFGSPKVLRDATAIVNPLQNYAYYLYAPTASVPYSSGSRTMQPFQVYDSPSTTSQITYKLQFQGHTSAQYAVVNPDTSNNFSTTSPAQSLTSMTIMEIAG